MGANKRKRHTFASDGEGFPIGWFFQSTDPGASRTHRHPFNPIFALAISCNSASGPQQRTEPSIMTNTDNESLPLTDAVVQLTGESGNAFAILGRVHRAILRSNHPELADPFCMKPPKAITTICSPPACVMSRFVRETKMQPHQTSRRAATGHTRLVLPNNSDRLIRHYVDAAFWPTTPSVPIAAI